MPRLVNLNFHMIITELMYVPMLDNDSTLAAERYHRLLPGIKSSDTVQDRRWHCFCGSVVTSGSRGTCQELSEAQDIHQRAIAR